MSPGCLLRTQPHFRFVPPHSEISTLWCWLFILQEHWSSRVFFLFWLWLFLDDVLLRRYFFWLFRIPRILPCSFLFTGHVFEHLKFVLTRVNHYYNFLLFISNIFFPNPKPLKQKVTWNRFHKIRGFQFDVFFLPRPECKFSDEWIFDSPEFDWDVEK